MDEIYVSTDIESDGPVPGLYSMLSFGSAAFRKNKKIVSTFSANLKCLPRARKDPETMKWWESQKKGWAACRKNLQNPKKAMQEYFQWIDKLPGKPVFVAYPASFDFNFINWYFIKFIGKNPFSYLALDIKSYAMALLKKPFYKVTKNAMPKKWFDKNQRSHVALEDAIEQGELFCNILAENSKRDS
ncbi:MAG: 3'-5' exoribonuclease [Candidatus Omnitrophica bacterium]|nr:3'-5' exoribonuclease [Candidatus Omnitrophota bacterium]MCF7878478.1 3'-5' exoribonuclease [Candidatus Omnitrophota bacterium]MCF7893277.1 3'-5' exoribonuclease [Candidatus Omnitrophota bacterium]